MKISEIIKQAIEPDMPDMEAVRQKCIEELHKGKERPEKTNKRKPNRKIRKSLYASLGVCAALWFCVLNWPVNSNAESFIARLQTWLRLDHESVTVGEMQKNAIQIPEDCEEVEYEGEKYLTKSYASPEELEEDIGKHLDIWRGVEEFKENGIVLHIVEGEYARVDFYYDISDGKVMGSTECGEKMQDLKCCITFPLSEDFSLNNIKLKDEVLKDATLDEKGNLIKYARNGDYSILESYHSAHLNANISVIERKKIENIDKRQDDVESYQYYYLYFVYKGLSYQINCNSHLEIVKSIVEELE